jgi:hypothetical protein
MRDLILRSEYGLSPTVRHRFAMKHALTIPDGLIYSYIPKNACTSLRYAAGKRNGFTGEISALQNIQDSIQANLTELRDAEYTFVVLRCPYRRLASMFFDKALRKPARFDCVRNRFTRVLNPGAEYLTFKKFVKLLEKPGALMAEHHWAPQTAFLIYHNYDDYFSVENIGEAFSILNKRFPIVDMRSQIGHDTSKLAVVEGSFADATVKDLKRLKASGSVPAYTSMFDDETKEIFDNLYSCDIRLFRELIGKTSFG